MRATVTLSGQTWETGKEVLDVEVVLGSADRSSSCKITLSDPLHLIASALINHSLKNGGIPELPKDKPQVNTAPAVTPAAKVSTGVSSDTSGEGTISKGGDFTPKVRAFLDLIAYKEVPPAVVLTRQGYYARNFTNEGFFTDADIAAGGGFPTRPPGYGRNIGRYQFQRADWDAARKFGYPITGYSPEQQDLIAIYKMKHQDRGWKELQAGDLKAAIKKAGLNWASLPGSPYGQVQAGYTLEQAIAYYNKRLAVYTGGVPQQPQPTTVAPPSPSATSTPQPVIKGSPLVVSIEGYEFSYYHTGTELAEDGKTVITGQGIRWSLSRRTKSRTYKDITLRQLAEKVAKEHKVSLSYETTINPTYSHLDQSGITDYQLLLREAEQSGLLVTEDKKQIVIKDRTQIGAPVLTLSRGSNLLSYRISDRAYSANEADISATLPGQNKATIDPITGKAVTTKDTKREQDNAITGKTSPELKGTQKGATAVDTEKARLKRIGGLPSTFTLSITGETLKLTPISSMLTKGLTGVLDRIWLVRKVTHNLAAGTTQLEVVSPVEVADSSPAPTPPPPKRDPSEPSQVNPGRWLYPCNGITTSLFGRRRKPSANASSFHRGVDIANGFDTPIYSVQDGTVVQRGFAQFNGNYVAVQHPNGFTSFYLHLNSPAPVRVGQVVKAGELVGLMGSTGIGSTGSHLHFGLKDNTGNFIDPAEYFPNFKLKGVTIVAKEATE